jgi:uncharacterized DUF497 family protein
LDKNRQVLIDEFRQYTIGADIEWDATKDGLNRKKHGLAFSNAISVFMDQNNITIFDEKHSSLEEERWFPIGRTETGTVCVVHHTYRVQDGVKTVRIFSARKAEKDEEIQYYSQWEGENDERPL